MCEECHASCSSCTGIEETNCVECAINLIKQPVNQDDHLCVSTCHKGYVKEGDTCDICHESCSSCNGTDEDSCIECS